MRLRAAGALALALWAPLAPNPAEAAPIDTEARLAEALSKLSVAPDATLAEDIWQSRQRWPDISGALALEVASARLRLTDRGGAIAAAQVAAERAEWRDRAWWIGIEAGEGGCAQRVERLQLIADDPPWIEQAPRLARLQAALAACGREEEAEASRVRLAVEHLHTAEGQAAAEGLTLSPESRLAQAEALVRARQYAEADALYAALLDSPLAQRAKMARARLRLAPWRMHFDEARRWFESVAGEGGPDAEEALYLAARAAGRLGAEDTEAAYQRYLSTHPTGAFAQEARFFRAFLSYERGRYIEAAERFRAVEGRRWGAAAEWYHAWSLRLAGHRDAAPALAALAARPGRGQLKARYWAARAIEARAPERARAQLKAIVDGHPWSWYGLVIRRAHPDLPAPLDVKALPKPALEGPPPAPIPTELAIIERVERLAAVGLRDHALRVVDAEAAGLARAGAWAVLYRISALAGDAARLRRLALVREPELLDRAPAPGDLAHLERAHPRPWPALVGSAPHGVPPELVWSFMWIESGFDPHVESAAHARGLMQLLERTALKIRRSRGMPQSGPVDLFDPATNIDLGAWYVAALSGRFDGQVPLFGAAYNAGPGAAISWLSQLKTPLEIYGEGGVPVDLFVERIPFRQSRAYAKRLCRLYFMYRLLAGEGGVEEAAAFLPLTIHGAVKPGVDF